jgi:hypothetical protein
MEPNPPITLPQLQHQQSLAVFEQWGIIITITLVVTERNADFEICGSSRLILISSAL